jgi:hypothetical protein
MLRTLALSAFLLPTVLPQTAPDPALLSLEQKEEFLKNAKVMKTRGVSKGITGTVRATLSDGNLTHDASIQTIDEQKDRFQGTMGTEINFRDTYKFNIAAYRLARLIGLEGMVPPSVERSYQGKSGAWTWWVEDVLGDEGDRVHKKITAPNPDQWARQTHIMRVFHQLIYNTDANNVGNILYDKNWRLWMIDHTRAFRMYTTLQNEKLLERCDRQLLANLKRLDEKGVRAELGKWLRPLEIKGIMARRDRIVAIFEKRGPQTLYDWLPAH